MRMSRALVIVTDDGPVRTVRMNRPDKKNALTLAMYDAMAAAIESAGDHRGIRCVLIAGAPGAFSAGNDHRRFRADGRAEASALGSRSCAFSMRWRAASGRWSPPCSGIAVGVGTTMLLHCDHVVAAQRRALLDALRQPRPGAGSRLEPDRAAPDGPRARLLAAGDGPAAERARRPRPAGLVNTVVAPDEVEAEAMKAAREIAALPPQGVLRRRAG